MLEVRVLPIADLVPADYNPRKALRPTDPAYGKLRASLERFGLVEPLVWNAATNRLVGGHARLRILRDLGHAEVPVAVVRLSAAAERALNVVLNNHEAQGRFDPSKLADLLAGLADLPELAATGFDRNTLAALRYQPAPGAGPADDRPAAVEVALVVPADRYPAVEPRIDAVVREFDLEAHVRHTPGEPDTGRPKRKGSAGPRVP